MISFLGMVAMAWVFFCLVLPLWGFIYQIVQNCKPRPTQNDTSDGTMVNVEESDV